MKHAEDGEVELGVPVYDWNRDLWVVYVLDEHCNEVKKISLTRYTLEAQEPIDL